MPRSRQKADVKSTRRNHTASARARRASHGLSVLEDIGAILSGSHDLQESLESIVSVVAERTSTEVCSLYLYDPRAQELTLWATEGLNKASVGKVRMALDEGLTGLVLERLEPVMVVDALAHPRYKYFPETGEERYHSFLGVPVVEYRTGIPAHHVFAPVEPGTVSVIGPVRMDYERVIPLVSYTAKALSKVLDH